MLYLKGSIKEEMNFDFRKIFPENCALAAAVNVYNASFAVYECLLAMENRGEAGVGIVCRSGNDIFQRRRVGSVSTQFNGMKEDDFARKLPGRIAIGHNRYATKGSSKSVANVQPLIIEKSKYGPFAIAHNGQLVNVDKIEKRLVDKGAIFQSTTDTELLVHLIAKSGKKTFEEALKYALKKVKTSYSLLILTQDKLYAIRDRFGVRPLSVAKYKNGYLICSETYAFDQFPEAEAICDISPGEMIIFSKGKKEAQHVQYAKPDEYFCIFEGIYFSNPRSRKINKVYHEDFRRETGNQIALECRKSKIEIKGDCIVPILDSGKHAALGLAHTLGIEYRELYQRTHSYKFLQARSFTAATVEERRKIVEKKLNLRKEYVVGKDIIIVDDSIVRSTTMKVLVRILKDAGARKVIVCVASPPINNICPSGMDYQETGQIIAHGKSIEEIRKIINADELIYLSLKGLKQVVRRTYNCGICCGCFGGRYPVKPVINKTTAQK